MTIQQLQPVMAGLVPAIYAFADGAFGPRTQPYANGVDPGQGPSRFPAVPSENIMLLPNGATVAVADGEKLHLFHNSGDEGHPRLTALPEAELGSDNHGSGARHHSSAANHDHGQLEEDSHSAGVAALLNQQATSGKIKHLVVIASPKALGELRKHYHKQVSAVLVGEIAKDLTGHGIQDIEKAIAAA